MRRMIAIGLVLAVAGVAGAGAQATGTTTFNAPYRAFTRAEFGAFLSFPNGGGTAFEGVYRMASGKFDIGFKGGLFDPSGPGKSVLLLGVEARERVIAKTADFPLDGALIFGVGANLVGVSWLARPSASVAPPPSTPAELLRPLAEYETALGGAW